MTQNKPHAQRRDTRVILADAGSLRTAVTYITQARATELYAAGVLSLVEIGGNWEYIMRAPLAQGAPK